MKFHITITNNETGETLQDLDTNVILAAIHSPEDEGTHAIAISSSGPVELATSIRGLQRIIDDQLERHPIIKLLLASISSEVAVDLSKKN